MPDTTTYPVAQADRLTVTAALMAAASTARPTMLARAALRMRPDVGGTGPTDDDLARLAIALATNSHAER